MDRPASLNFHGVERVVHDARRRTLTVTHVERLTPHMQRIHFASPELHDFASAAPDDHIKLFFPAPGQAGSDDDDMLKRDYTPRYVDRLAGTLTIDFALHEAGPATAWALAAQAGATLRIGGPRKSTVVSDDFDWYLLVGDETALPAIGRRIESLRAGVPVTSVIVTGDSADRQQFTTAADWTGLWVERDGIDNNTGLGDDTLLLRVLSVLELPRGDGYVWIGAEGQVARRLGDYMTVARGQPKEWIKAASYWHR